MRLLTRGPRRSLGLGLWLCQWRPRRGFWDRWPSSCLCMRRGDCGACRLPKRLPLEVAITLPGWASVAPVCPGLMGNCARITGAIPYQRRRTGRSFRRYLPVLSCGRQCAQALKSEAGGLFRGRQHGGWVENQQSLAQVPIPQSLTELSNKPPRPVWVAAMRSQGKRAQGVTILKKSFPFLLAPLPQLRDNFICLTLGCICRMQAANTRLVGALCHWDSSQGSACSAPHEGLELLGLHCRRPAIVPSH